MFLTNHALTGTLIGLEIEQPVVIAPVAFASHFFLDGLPHFGHPKFNFQNRTWLLIGAIDSVCATGVVIAACVLWPHRSLRIILGAFFAMLPDLFYVPEILFNKRLDGKLRVVHAKIQWSETPAGILVEGGWAAAMIAFLRHKH